jgi:proteasome lid subunit RPN8/RPN11
MALKITIELYNQLRRQGEKTYPNECCGVLVGNFDAADEKVVRTLAPCGNTRTDSSENRYGIDPRELVRIRREAILAGCDIVGFYHSHPDGSPRWSATDLAEAHWTGCSYVITGVENGNSILTQSFLLRNDEKSRYFENEILEVVLP